MGSEWSLISTNVYLITGEHRRCTASASRVVGILSAGWRRLARFDVRLELIPVMVLFGHFLLVTLTGDITEFHCYVMVDLGWIEK